MLNFNVMKISFTSLFLMLFFRCANDNDSTPEKKHWKCMLYEVLIFEYPDTGNNSSPFIMK
jgi:hypothetical protein